MSPRTTQRLPNVFRCDTAGQLGPSEDESDPGFDTHCSLEVMLRDKSRVKDIGHRLICHRSKTAHIDLARGEAELKTMVMPNLTNKRGTKFSV